ncbi:MAG: flavodoxin domain-containing protein [Trueperaceae bacterium]|nr:flavodoxin domain-containing protein [Trueperaceae bacterium]
MIDTVLVTYASRHHATAEIAAEIAHTLQDSGLTVDVAPVDHLVSVEAYRAVIAGSAIYDGEWLPNGVQFLTDHVAQLETVPTWFFSSGPLAPPRDAVEPAELPATLTTLRSRIKPRDTVVFGGRLEPHHLSLGEWLSHPAIRHIHGDFRDWDDIRSWAEGVARTLQQDRDLLADDSANARR